MPVYRLRYPAAVLLLALLVFFWRDYLLGFSMVAVTFLVSLLVKRLEINKLGIETATLFIVLSGYQFGPETGAVMALFLILAQLLPGKPGAYVLWLVPACVAGGYLAGVYRGVDITVIGPLVSAGIQSVFVVFTLLVNRQKLASYFQYAAFNVVFNLLLFTAAGPVMVQLLPA